MKRTVFALISTLALAGCVTSQITSEQAKPAPAERLYGFGQKQAPDDVAVTVIRDRGLYGSGCGLVIRIDGKRGAMLNAGEKATLYAAAGDHTISVGVSGQGLCAGMVDKAIDMTLKPNQSRTYRVSADQTGFQINPYVMRD